MAPPATRWRHCFYRSNWWACGRRRPRVSAPCDPAHSQQLPDIL